MRLLQFLYSTVLGLGLAACDEPVSKPVQPAVSTSSSVSVTPGAPSAAAAAALPLPPVTAGEKVSFTTADGETLSGELWPGKSPKAPLLVLVHRYRGDRREWTPLLARLQRDLPGSFRTLAFDLRGHKTSRKQPDGKDHYWGAFEKKELPNLQQDVVAALAAGGKGAEPHATVLVGSSLGGTFAALAAKHAQVTALGLVCPGGGIEGVDLFRPFAAFATAIPRPPVLLMTGRGDNVSRGTVGTLHKMAHQAKVHEYDGRQHSAQFLGQQRPELWDDLVSWLRGVRSRPRSIPTANPNAANSNAASSGVAPPLAPSASKK